MKPKLLVSSCLLGKPCAYDGEHRLSLAVTALCSRYECVDVCPEVYGGLGCPRVRHEISGGDGESVLRGDGVVITSSGDEHTAEFMRGAEASLENARQNGIKIAVMKSHSPSCGKYFIHAGKFDGEMRGGSGVTAAMFQRNGIKVFTEDEVEEARSALEASE